MTDQVVTIDSKPCWGCDSLSLLGLERQPSSREECSGGMCLEQSSPVGFSQSTCRNSIGLQDSPPTGTLVQRELRESRLRSLLSQSAPDIAGQVVHGGVPSLSHVEVAVGVPSLWK